MFSKFSVLTVLALNVQFVVGTPNGSSSTAPAKSESVSTMTDSNPTASTQTGSILGGLTPQSQFQQQQQQYWAKGTGFGTGSTAQTWDLDGAMQRQRQQEEQATCLLHTLAAYVHPSCPPTALIQPGFTGSPVLPVELLNIVLASHLVAAICSYLRNDSGSPLFVILLCSVDGNGSFLIDSDGHGSTRATLQGRLATPSLYCGLP